MLTPEQQTALRDRLAEAFTAAAVQVLQVRDVGEVTALGERAGAEAKRVRLAEVAITMAASAIAEEQAKQAATAAARLGASYTDLGAAAGITRQGARSRWPGLATLADAARRAGRRPAPEATQREVGRADVGHNEVEIEFEHTVTAWTVGDLRAALRPVPGDMPVLAITAEKPGGDIEGETQVVRGTVLNASPLAAEHDRQRFVLQLDFPSGTYQRRVPGPFGRSTHGEEFTHDVEPMTAVGMLAALDGLPGDMSVLAWLAEEPGSEHGEEQIVYDAAIGLEWSPPVRGEREGEWVAGHHFDLQLEYPTGRYLRSADR